MSMATKQKVSPSNPDHPLHCLVLSMFECQNQALSVFNSTDFLLIDPSTIKDKLKQCGLIYLLYQHDKSNENKETIFDYLSNENLITNLIKHTNPKKINYFDLCSIMSSILNNSNNNKPNKVYAINCKQYHYFKQIKNMKQSESNDEDDMNDEYDSDSDPFAWTEIIDPHEMQNDTFMALTADTAKDVTHFRQYILEKNSKPPIDTLTYCGMFNEYYFDKISNKKDDDNMDNKEEEEEEVICVNYCYSRNKLPDTLEFDDYISIELDSNINIKNWKRPKLNVVIVMDISGSMTNSFGFMDKSKSKIDIAKQCLIQLLKEQLNKMDRFGLIIFNDDIEAIQSLELIGNIDIDTLEQKINEIKAVGGTNMYKGYTSGIALFNDVIDIDDMNDDDDNDEYENRIILLTDANPTDFNGDDIMELNMKYSNQYKTNCKRNIYCSFIGVGLEFDDEFIMEINECRGSNYLTVFSEKEFVNVMNTKFNWMVTPILFDITLELRSPDNSCIIQGVYGMDNTMDIGGVLNGQIIKKKTLFPCKPNIERKQQSKGGMVLIKIGDKYNDIDDIKEDDEKEVLRERDFDIEHRIGYEYEIEYEFNVCNVKESILTIEELMEYYTIKTEWTEDHHKLITFLHENKIYNQFDLTDEQNINGIKKGLSRKALNGDIKYKRLQIKFDEFMVAIYPLINAYKHLSNNKVTPSVESSRYAILLQKHINKLLLKKPINPSLKQSDCTEINITPQQSKDDGVDIDDEKKEKKEIEKGYNLELIIKYENNKYEGHIIKKHIYLKRDNIEYYENKSMRKAILLQNYVKICKAWINNGDNIDFIQYLETKFMPYFQTEINEINDNNLFQEIEILNEIISISKKEIMNNNIDGICDKNTKNSMKQMILSYNPLQCIFGSSYMMKEIIHPIDIYNNAFREDFISNDYNIRPILPNYDNSPNPLSAIYELMKNNKKYTIILVPIYINLKSEFIKTKCVLIAHDHEALSEHGVMFYYDGLILSLKKSLKNSYKNDLDDLDDLDVNYSLNDEKRLIDLLEMNIDYNTTSKLRKYPFMFNCINQWLYVGCGAIIIHNKNGLTVDIAKFIIKNGDDEGMDDEKIRAIQQLQKLLFLCNIEGEIAFNNDIIPNQYKCEICKDLMINPVNIGNNDECKHNFCNLCITKWREKNIDKKNKKNKCPMEFCDAEIKDIILMKDLNIEIEQNSKIPITIYKQIIKRKSVMNEREKVLNEYYKKREEELNKMQLQQRIMNDSQFGYKMGGY